MFFSFHRMVKVAKDYGKNVFNVTGMSNAADKIVLSWKHLEIP